MSEPERTELPERWTVAEDARPSDDRNSGSTPPDEGSGKGTPPRGGSSGETAGEEVQERDGPDAKRPRHREDASPGGGPGRRERIDRSRSRAWALQILYRWESGGMKGSLLEAVAETRRTRRIAPSRIPRVERLMEVLDDRLPEVDRAIDGALDNWRLERLSTIDRAVLRIGAAELLFMEDIPPRASIQEAVRLADQYGGDESARFVNGVLDALYHR